MWLKLIAAMKLKLVENLIAINPNFGKFLNCK